MKGRALVLLALVGLVGTGCLQRKDEVTSAQVVRRDIDGFEVLRGSLVLPPGASAEIYSPYRAPVREVKASVGSNVNRGQTLVQLDLPNVDETLRQAREYVAQAEAAYKQARASLGGTLDQLKQQYDQARQQERAARANMDPNIEGIAQTRMQLEQQIKSEQANLDANLATYKAQLDDAKQYLADAQSGLRQGAVKSPIAGKLIALNAQPGVEVGVDREHPLATVVNLAALQVHAPIPTDLPVEVKEGTRVVLLFKDLQGKEYDGKVARITTLPAEDDKLVRTAIIEFANEGAQVMPNMTLQMVGIRTGKRENVLAVPNGALSVDGSGKPTVRVLRDGKWLPTVVEVGLRGVEYTEIRSGLSEGDTVQVRIKS